MVGVAQSSTEPQVALHVPSMLQPYGVHCFASSEPGSAALHRPSSRAPAALEHDRQGPSPARSKQTPSAQKPLLPSLPLAHGLSAQPVATWYFAHEPAPSHVPSRSQRAPESAHAFFGSVPTATGPHVPS